MWSILNMISCNCLNVGTDNEIDVIRLSVIKMLFDDELELNHCEVANDPYSKEISLKFERRKV